MVELARERPEQSPISRTVRGLPKAIADEFGADIVAAAAKAGALAAKDLPAPEPALSATDRSRADALMALLQQLCPERRWIRASWQVARN